MASVTKRYQSLGKGLVSQYEPGYREAGKTPLFAAARSGSVEIANMLFHSGADLRARDLNDWTVVHEAAQAGKADVLQFFIQKGASPNAASKAGFRPLHVAMRGPSGLPAIECIQVLLKSGASPNMRNETGQTPLDLLTSDYRRALSSRSAENPNLSPAYKAGVAQAEHLLKVAMKRPTAKPAPAKVSPKAPKKPAKKARAPRKHIGP
jgi:ankyrin repeat protein